MAASLCCGVDRSSRLRPHGQPKPHPTARPTIRPPLPLSRSSILRQTPHRSNQRAASLPSHQPPRPPNRCPHAPLSNRLISPQPHSCLHSNHLRVQKSTKAQRQRGACLSCIESLRSARQHSCPCLWLPAQCMHKPHRPTAWACPATPSAWPVMTSCMAVSRALPCLRPCPWRLVSRRSKPRRGP